MPDEHESSEAELPIMKHREEIIETIRENFVTIISAQTGSGKTTQVPQFIYDDAQARGESCRILISQPRKIAAITIATRAAKERNCEVGELVGYQVGLDKKVHSDEKSLTRLMFCTTGVILQKMINEKNMTSYSHIILDEIHEREIDMDLLLVIVREFLLKNSVGTKLILMSATLNADIFVDYFTFNFKKAVIQPGVIELKSKREFEIKKFYLENLGHFGFQHDVINYMKPGISTGLYKLAEKIIIQRIANSEKSILVFLPGVYEIDSLNAILKSSEELQDNCLICVLYSSLSVENQKIAFRPANKPKIILSTNIAESSVTISGVDCVIDFCLCKVVKSVKNTTMSSLTMDWAAMDSLEQRSGRTGRTCDGVVYRLIHRSHFVDRLRRFSIPEMERVPLETTVLRIKLFDVEPPLKLLAKALSPPETSEVKKALLILKELGGLQRLESNFKFDYEDGKMTWVGRIMASLPVDVRISKFIVLGYIYSVLDEAIIIGAGLNIRSIFRTSQRERLDDYSRKMTWADGSSCDFMAILNAYKLWKFMTEQGLFSDWKAEQVWCHEFNLERKSLHEMRELIREIRDRLSALKMTELTGKYSVTWEEREKPVILKICIAGAFLPNFFISGESIEYVEQDIQKQIGGKNPFRTVYFNKMDKKYFGQVYDSQIKQKMVEAGVCRHAEDIKLTFDKGSSKVFMEFLSDEVDLDQHDESGIHAKLEKISSCQVAGKISSEIYRAVKLRKIGYRLKIDVMSTEETVNYAKKHGIYEERIMFEKAEIKNRLKYPEYCVIPLTCTSSLTGVVTSIVHLGKFYIQPKTEQNIIDGIHEKLAEDEKEAYENVNELKRHQLVIALHEDKMKRTKIIDTKARDQLTRCYLFDYGKVVKLPVAKVFKIPNELEEVFELPECCFEASLSEISPSFLKCPRGKWTSKAIEKLSSLVLGREVTVEVFSVVEDIASVKLLVDGVSVNEIMIEDGFAQECDEYFARKHDFQVRKKIQINEDNFYGPEVEFSERVNKLRVVQAPPPPKSMCKGSLMLGGPFSPLETSLSSISLNPPSGGIIIDPVSVNSVVLYDDPTNIYGRLIVAANVTKGTSGSVLHETTIMPDIPGLPVLLAMIFAPDVIFRRNEEKTVYDSMQFGLGADDQDRPYFSAHDCILPVNFELDYDDFHDINFVRFLMSYLVDTVANGELGTLKDENKFDFMTKIKKTIIKILSKIRSPVASCYVSYEFKDWKTDDQKFAVVWDEVFIGGGLYHHFRFPKLRRSSAEEIAETKKKLDKLQSQINASMAIALLKTDSVFSFISTRECTTCA